jgi:ribonuclease P/MRP protein subunit POP5
MAKNKIKPILPTLREKKRYVAIEIVSKDSKFTADEVSKAVIKGAKEYLGVRGAAKAGLIFLSEKYDASKSRGIIRVSNPAVDDLKMALMSIRSIAGKDIIIRTLGVSGILKKAIEKFQAKEIIQTDKTN